MLLVYIKKFSAPFIILLILTSCLEDNDDGVLTPDEQFEVDIAKIDQYLAVNNITAQTEINGVRYVVHNPGDSISVEISNTIKVAYEGRLFDGTIFDSSPEATFPLGNLIAGWQIGVPLIKEGGSITLYIPSAYAYGTRGTANGSIPPNANVIFDIELLEVL
ncbi:MAG: FKBP-type peptidyl-prolyl cis-trans isomerase [Cyclobacteriaceae bacterium]